MPSSTFRVLGLHYVILNLQPSQAARISTITPINRPRGRDVHIYNANSITTVLGGMILTISIMNASFYLVVEILFIFTSTFFLWGEGDTKIKRDDHPLQPGKDYIIAAGGYVHNLPFVCG
ncbi:hypothetical protein K469DRAFT_1391 [Zopfia rhizophila CBS 207.26]|uniref:DUF7881 domain-containing protein n=1 Tax=Zopfia rhizophila CBS 207.26 TaxID=1314779 RepID=A0A6A6ES61_9PEZI|nr:hypothetical protein K469DRAFT_1391 [Zopfia rhizophila CBS 207.26]